MALPPPACCPAIRPGRLLRIYCVVVCGRNSRSRARIVSDDAACVGRRSITISSLRRAAGCAELVDSLGLAESPGAACASCCSAVVDTEEDSLELWMDC